MDNRTVASALILDGPASGRSYDREPNGHATSQDVDYGNLVFAGFVMVILGLIAGSFSVARPAIREAHIATIVACAGPERVSVETRKVAVDSDDYPVFLSCINNQLPNHWELQSKTTTIQAKTLANGYIDSWEMVPGTDDSPPLPTKDVTQPVATMKSPSYGWHILGAPFLLFQVGFFLSIFLSSVWHLYKEGWDAPAIVTGGLSFVTLMPFVAQFVLCWPHWWITTAGETHETTVRHVERCVEEQQATLNSATRVITGKVNVKRFSYCFHKADDAPEVYFLNTWSDSSPIVATFNQGFGPSWVIAHPHEDQVSPTPNTTE